MITTDPVCGMRHAHANPPATQRRLRRCEAAFAGDASNAARPPPTLCPHAVGHEMFRLEMKATPPDPAAPKRRRPSNLTLNIFAVLIGVVTFGLGAAWVIYTWLVDREAPYFAIPLVFSVPVIVAVAVRSIWE